MKSKLVLWGSNAQDEKILIAVALRPEDNKIDIYTFPESVATDDFYQQMMKDWRDSDAGFVLPEPYTHVERELSVSESLLPDDIKSERTDVINRAQTEWHFIVLSSKLHQAYSDELNDLKDRVEQLEKYDQGIWDNLKEFWDKVQEQSRDRTLFQGHVNTLRDGTNVLFGKMKELRTKLDSEMDRLSSETRDKFLAALDELEAKAESGGRLPALFDELKRLQRKYRETKMSRDHREKVWQKLDAAFKNIKQRRFGNKAVDETGTPSQKLQRRYDGLISAIEKMEQSIRRDRKDLEFQEHKISTTDGQLEAQIRQAKILMIEERVRSKEEKLAEMNATKIELDKRLASLKEKEARRAAQENIKGKIAENIKTASEAREDVAEKLEKAASEIADAKTPKEQDTPAKKGDTLLGAASAALSESLEDVVDTIKAVAQILGEKIEDAVEDLKKETATGTESPAPAAPEANPDADTPVSEETLAVQEDIGIDHKGQITPAEASAAETPVSEVIAEVVEETIAAVPVPEVVTEHKGQIASVDAVDSIEEVQPFAEEVAALVEEAVAEAKEEEVK